MAGTSVLSLPPDQDHHHRLDVPLHYNLKTDPVPSPQQQQQSSLVLPTSDTTTTTTSVGGLDIINEHDEDEQDHDTVRQQYENMTYDDLSRRMSENYKQLSSILGNIGSGIKEPPTRSNSDDDNSHFPNTATTTDPTTEDDNTDLEDDDTLIHNNDLDDATKRRKMTKLFCRAATTGDVDKVTQWLEEPYRGYIDIDARDEDGTTPLIYAACFGKTAIAQALLNAGAKTDVQDSCK